MLRCLTLFSLFFLTVLLSLHVLSYSSLHHWYWSWILHGVLCLLCWIFGYVIWCQLSIKSICYNATCLYVAELIVYFLKMFSNLFFLLVTVHCWSYNIQYFEITPGSYYSRLKTTTEGHQSSPFRYLLDLHMLVARILGNIRVRNMVTLKAVHQFKVEVHVFHMGLASKTNQFYLMVREAPS